MFTNAVRICFQVVGRSPASKRNFNAMRKNAIPNFKIPSSQKYLCLTLFNVICMAKADAIKVEDNTNNYKKLINEEINSLITQADELFSVGKFQECFKLLETFKDSNNVEVLWRLSRALYNLSKQKGISKIEHEALIEDSYKCIEKALNLDDENFAVHKWMAILYDAKSSLSGIKSRINALPIFKQHLLKAIELNPKDATSVYMLGQYMYSIADMSRLQKIIAQTLFGTPPEATFEEAFSYFIKAEEIEPNFYSANLLMLGKTSIKLKKLEAAHYWLKCASAYPVRTDEDEAVRLEAEELLKKYPGIEKSEEKTQTYTK